MLAIKILQIPGRHGLDFDLPISVLEFPSEFAYLRNRIPDGWSRVFN